MDYISPLNATPTPENPRPPYIDGNLAAGQRGSFPSGKVFEYLQKELLAVIEGAGLTPSNGNLGQLLQAIQLLAAGAGGEAAVFAYNPVFPHVTANGGVVSISGSNGQVVVNAGQSLIHRGGTLYSLDDFDLGERTFALVANKTYHLRWRYNAGTPTLDCIDAADAGYNPSAKAETDRDFDSTFDDMLIARVVTDASNDTTVTALKNLQQLSASFSKDTMHQQGGGTWAGLPALSGTLNWARTPDMLSISNSSVEIGASTEAEVYRNASATRYACSGFVAGYNDGPGGSYISGTLTLRLRA